MESGITPTPEQIELYKELSVNRTYKFLIFKLNKSRDALEVCEEGKALKEWDELKGVLPLDDPR